MKSFIRSFVAGVLAGFFLAVPYGGFGADDRFVGPVHVQETIPFQLPELKSVPERFRDSLEKLGTSGTIEIREQPPLTLDFVPQHLSVSADGSKLVLAKWKPEAEVWDLKTRERLSTYQSGSDTPAQLWTGITPNGEHGLLTHPAGRVDVFDTSTGNKAFSHNAPQGTVGPVAVSGDGKSSWRSPRISAAISMAMNTLNARSSARKIC